MLSGIAIILSLYAIYRTRGISVSGIGYKKLWYNIQLYLGRISPPIDGGDGGHITFQPGKGGKGDAARGGVDGKDGQILFENADGEVVAYIDESGILKAKERMPDDK